MKKDKTIRARAKKGAEITKQRLKLLEHREEQEKEEAFAFFGMMVWGVLSPFTNHYLVNNLKIYPPQRALDFIQWALQGGGVQLAVREVWNGLMTLLSYLFCFPWKISSSLTSQVLGVDIAITNLVSVGFVVAWIISAIIAYLVFDSFSKWRY